MTLFQPNHVNQTEKEQKNEKSNLQQKLRSPLTINTNIEPPEIKENQNLNKMSPTTVKDVKDIILSSSKNILGKVLSPSKDKIQGHSGKKVEKKSALMTRRELTDPFGSDEEDETQEPAQNDTQMDSRVSDDTDFKTDADNKSFENDESQKELPKSAQVISLFYPIFAM